MRPPIRPRATSFDARLPGEIQHAARRGSRTLLTTPASIARVLAASGGYNTASLCRPDGFAGVDGLLALQPDGTVRRGLAVFRIVPGGASMIDPAPTSLSAPGI